MPPPLVLAAALAAAPPPAGPEPPVDEAAIRELLADQHGLDRAGIAAAGGYGPAAFPLYHRLLGDVGDRNRWVAIRTLVVLADPNMKGDRSQFLDRAAALLAHPHVSPRVEAANLIGAIGSARDAPPVVGLLWDEDRSMTYSAAKALAAVGDRRAADALEVWLKRADHRDDNELRRLVENFQVDIAERLKKEEDARKARPPAKK